MKYVEREQLAPATVRYAVCDCGLEQAVPGACPEGWGYVAVPMGGPQPPKGLYDLHCSECIKAAQAAIDARRKP